MEKAILRDSQEFAGTAVAVLNSPEDLPRAIEAVRQSNFDRLLLLDATTVATTHALDRLHSTFDMFPDTGAVAARVLAADGTVLEVGGVVWSDGTYAPQAGPDAGAPHLNYLREVDYCSAAAMLVSTCALRALPRVPTDEIDLAFLLRRQGYRSFVQAVATVQCARVLAASRAEIVEHLRTAHAEALAQQHHPGTWSRKALDRNRKARLLVVDIITPTPDMDAGSLTAYYFSRIFRNLGFDVSFIPEDNFLNQEKYTALLQEMGIEAIYYPQYTSVGQYMDQHAGEFDAIFIYRVPAAHKHLELIRQYCPTVPVIFDTTDLYHLREERQAALYENAEMAEQAKITRAREFAAMRRSDMTIVLSTVEQEYLREVAPDVKTRVVPLALEIPGRRTGFGQRREIAYIGGYRHLPNVDAVKYFMSAIWPLVKQSQPDMRFLIVGSHPPEEILAFASADVEVTGFVEDIAPILDSVRLTVAPLRYGAGIKGKIGSSLSHGTPCVISSLAAEGMPITNGTEALVVDDPAAFAKAILDVYGDEALWTRLSDGGLTMVNRHYGLETISQMLRDLFQDAGVAL